MTDSAQDPNSTEKEAGFMSHLIELRDRLLKMMLSILVIFLGLFYWANDIYTYLAQPLISHLPEGSSMIAIDVASPFLTPFKLVLMLSVFLAMPFILYQLWAFVAPGLYKHEKRLAVPLLISSVCLFYAGIAFAYYVVFPLVFGFFTSIGPEAVSIMTDIGRYLDFVLSLFFGFGLAFEVPIATIIIIAIGLTTPDKLAEKRPYVIVAAFIVGMLLTPPDVISQVMLAVPMWLLFESGLMAARYLLPAKTEEDEEELNEDELDETGPASDSFTDNSIGGAGFASDYEVVEDPAQNIHQSATTNSDTEEKSEEEDDEYTELTEEEMEAELDKMDEEEFEEDDELEKDDSEKDDKAPEPNDSDSGKKDEQSDSKKS